MNLLDKIVLEIVNPVIVLLISLAFGFFIWGVVEMIYYADNEEKRSAGKKHLIWGLVGLFIMLSVAGIIQIIQNFWESV